MMSFDSLWAELGVCEDCAQIAQLRNVLHNYVTL